MTSRSQARKRQLYGKDSSGYSNPGGAQPVAPHITASPTIALAASVMTCTPGAATGTPTPTPSYQWRLDGSDLIGATNVTLNVGAIHGPSVTCRVAWSNPAGADARVSNAIVAP